MKVYLCTHDCYSSTWTHGVYATPEAAMADHEPGREWQEETAGDLHAWSSGKCIGGASGDWPLVAIEEYEVRGGG